MTYLIVIVAPFDGLVESAGGPKTARPPHILAQPRRRGTFSSIDRIDESANVRRSFSEEKLRELASSIRQRGVLNPILVRPNGERFKLIDGWRRLSAAKLAECRTIPVRVRDVDANAAEEEMIIANLHHEDVTPLDEATSFQGLLDKGRTVDELAAKLGKTKRHIYQVLTLNRLVPDAQDLLARDILPLNYAIQLATVPAARQADGLERCFRPLFGRDERRRDLLEPLAELTGWIAKSARFDPRREARTGLSSGSRRNSGTTFSMRGRGQRTRSSSSW